jgi:hypothetical protein
VSSVGTASVAVQATERCLRDTGVTYGQAVGALSDEDSNPFGLLGDRLGPAVVWAHMEASLVPATGSPATPVVILTRDGALDHVDVIDGSPGPGLWVSDRITDKAGLRAGDRAVLLGGNAPRPVDLPIAGVYRDVPSWPSGGPTATIPWRCFVPASDPAARCRQLAVDYDTAGGWYTQCATWTPPSTADGSRSWPDRRVRASRRCYGSWPGYSGPGRERWSSTAPT